MFPMKFVVAAQRKTRLPIAVIYIIVAIFLALTACGKDSWNNPYPPQESELNIHYAPFSGRPKHLDPAQSYSSNEIAFTAQIYEPPLQYHFLKRPYELIPLTTTEIPKAVYIDKQGNPLPEDAAIEEIAYTLYEIQIQPGIMYQPHPAFAKDAQGSALYLNLSPEQIEKIFTLNDFSETGTRELVANDYIYEIKRLANPRIHSPIFGLMSEYIVGLADYGKHLAQVSKQLGDEQNEAGYLDLSQYDLEGVQLLDRYTYRVKIYGKYPQFLYWLAMPFFAPIPPEVDQFY